MTTEMANETMFYVIGTRLALKYVDIIKRKCNAWGVCEMCMHASVDIEGTEKLKLEEE